MSLVISFNLITYIVLSSVFELLAWSYNSYYTVKWSLPFQRSNKGFEMNLKFYIFSIMVQLLGGHFDWEELIGCEYRIRTFAVNKISVLSEQNCALQK